MDFRVLASVAIASLVLLAAPASAVASATPEAADTDQEPCGGIVAVGCEHWSANGPCVLYVSPRCIIWLN